MNHLSIVCALALMFGMGARAANIKPSRTLPTEGTPEFLYAFVNGNGVAMNSTTGTTQTEANYGSFAFYDVEGVEGAYYMYAYNAQKWVTYSPAAGYSNKKNFVSLKEERSEKAYFKVTNYTGNLIEFQPYTTSGTNDKYLNWYQGVDGNPLDRAGVTLGLWEQSGAEDKGSRWTFTEVTLHEYRLILEEGVEVTIKGKTYKNGDTYVQWGSLSSSDVVAPAVEGRTAIVVVDDAAGTITVSYVVFPEQDASEVYTLAQVYPQQQEAVGAAQLTHEDGLWTLSNKVLKVGYMKVDGALFFAGSRAMGLEAGTEPFVVGFGSGTAVAASNMALLGVEEETLEANPQAVGGAEHFAGKAIVARYRYTYGEGTVEITWRAVLRDGSHYLRTEMALKAVGDVDMYDVIPLLYHVNTTTTAQPVVVGNTRGAVVMSNTIFSGLENPVAYNTVGTTKNGITPIQGRWSRNTTLQDGETWTIGGVVGLVAQDANSGVADYSKNQKRRSFLAYSERERAVPWRPYPCYISWYELNINRNNAKAPGYVGNMTIAQCENVVNHWKTSFFDKYGEYPAAFVFDDGWDEYGTWTFNCNFPNGFREMDDLARKQHSGIGAWLGPVGGYGTSGDYRRAYWTNKGGMQLSNPDYYRIFLAAAKNLTQDQGYDFRFFKFDGISAQFSATGPDAGDTGNENAEGIIRLEQYVRDSLRRDIFFNTTVGTWASPFWYHITDATWRQENDYGTSGNNKIDREKWVTYRDRLVYKNYVTNSPICPINTLMTHGFILSKFGNVSSDRSYDAVLREMRCAFGCGSGMVELYNDYSLMDEIANSEGVQGVLWKDLADLIRWQRKNADVLPDIHWVGGNPWDDSNENIYGWAAWNGEKAVLTLRNGDDDSESKTLTTTLRDALNIPLAYAGKTVSLRKAFNSQADLEGWPAATEIDIDEELTLVLPKNSVFMFSTREASETYTVVVEGNTKGGIVYGGKTFKDAETVIPEDGFREEDFSAVNVLGFVAQVVVNHTDNTITARYTSIFSTAEDPQYFQVVFKSTSNALEDQGAGKNLCTALADASADAQLWRFEGNTTSCLMISKLGNYVGYTGASTALRFCTGAEKSSAKILRIINSAANTNYFEIQRKLFTTKSFNQWGESAVGQEIGEYAVGDENNLLSFVYVVPTGIENSGRQSSVVSHQSSVICDLTGCRVVTPQRGHIYIQNGKKILY